MKSILVQIYYPSLLLSTFFFFNDPATTEIYTLSLHDALPISAHHRRQRERDKSRNQHRDDDGHGELVQQRSEEHTSELQSHHDLVCRLLLEKKKKTIQKHEECIK